MGFDGSRFPRFLVPGNILAFVHALMSSWALRDIKGVYARIASILTLAVAALIYRSTIYIYIYFDVDCICFGYVCSLEYEMLTDVQITHLKEYWELHSMDTLQHVQQHAAIDCVRSTEVSLIYISDKNVMFFF